ncbi:MAG: glycosyltransferase family 4 protein [Sedimentisphaerales bacterium]|nr:glycosyltransferase family 4 protein [Sedimentisphaerales bacterium]
MSRLNLLMLNYEFPPIGGGAANAHLCLLKQYTNHDELKIDVLTSAPQPGFASESLSEKITIYKVGVHKKQLHYWRKIEIIEWLLRADFHYRKMLRQKNYDLVHAFFGFPTGWLCYRTANRLPYVISLRGSDVPGQHARLAVDYKLLGPLFKRIWKKASALVACSEGLKTRALRFLPSVTIDVIPNGVDSERFFPLGKKLPSDELKLITVGRLSVTKRIEILIDAVDILIKQGYKVRFLIIGGGAAEDSLRRSITEKNLTPFIELTGRMEPERVPDFYRSSDIYVSATMQEGMSNAMLEAMASGLPIVTTNYEGAEELIANNGIIVEQAGAEQIAEAIKQLADDYNRREQLSIEARKRAEQFTWKKVADKYLECYQEVLKVSIGSKP